MENGNQNVVLIQEKLKNLLCDVIYHNQLDTSLVAENAIWYANSELLHFENREVEYYLEHTLMHGTEEEPKIEFVNSEYVGEECLAVTGKMEWYSSADTKMLHKVIFHANWQLCDTEWKLKQLVTSRTKEIVEKKAVTGQMNTLDDRRLLQTFPTGLICCSKEEHLPIRRMNEKLLSMLDYETVKDYNRYTGNLLMTSIHPEDIPKFRAYVQALTEGEEVDDICVRLRKRDYSYLPVQIFGGNLGDAWIVFACVDYSEQQERLDNLKEKSRKLADLRDDYRVLIDNLPSGFHRCALHDPIHIDYVSDNFCQMTGYS